MNSKVKKTSIVAVTVASFAIFAGSVSAQPGLGNGGQGGPGGRGDGQGRPPMAAPFGQNPPNGELPFTQEGGNNQPPFNQDGTSQQPPFANGERPDRPIVDLLQSAIEATGLTPEEIREQIEAGATLEDLLTEAGTSIDAIIDQAVTDGELTEEQAQELKDRIAEGNFPNLPGPFGGPGRDHFPVRAAVRGAIEATVELTGLEAAEIREQLQAGATIKEILEANGSNVDALVDVLVAEAIERLAAQVEEGKITQEQADERLADLETRLTERLNEGLRPFQDDATEEEATEEAADA